MAYWDSEADEPRLYVYDPGIVAALGVKRCLTRGVSIWREDHDAMPHKWRDTECDGTWCGPSLWVGPLSCPGGPFGTTIVEFDQEAYDDAMEHGLVMVLQHRDYSATNRGGGTETVVKLEDDRRGDDE